MKMVSAPARHGSLRTQLFLTVAAVVSVAVAASSLLSRRATLVEVREIVQRPPAVPVSLLESVKARIEALSGADADVGAVLADAGRSAGRPLLLLRADGSIAGASEGRFASATARRGPAAGDLSLDIDQDGARTTIAVRGAPPLAVHGPQGTSLLLYALPPSEERERERVGPLPPWVLTTIAIGGIALVVTFVLSRRILRPVGDLTLAAERMERGSLGVQVEVRGDDEIARLGRAFNAMSARLAEVERLRRQMATDVAHELRSPVTNLRCGLEAMQDGLAPTDRRGIDALHEEIVFLQRLIEDLQVLSLAEAGRLELRLGTVDLEAVVRRAAAPAGGARRGFGAAAPARGGGAPRAVRDDDVTAPVTVTVVGSIPPFVADADRLEQVFRNLISNARRYTPPDGAIVATLRSEDGRAIVEVRDTGAGIHPDHMPHLFERFYRADSSRARATGGAGLGLAIARQIVLAHGGSITAASGGLNAGATFTVTLPCGP